MSYILGYVATGVALAFAGSMFLRWRRRGGPHHAAWAIAMVMFALASLALTLGIQFGWNATIFRVYYLFGAILNVPFLGLGSVYLLWGERAGYVMGLLLVAFALAATITVLTAPMPNPPSGHAIPSGKDVYSSTANPKIPDGCDNSAGSPGDDKCAPFARREPLAVLPRIFAVFGNIIGTLLVIVGTLGSAWRFVRRRREDPTAGRLALGNLLIAIGVIVVASGGTSARFGGTAILPATLASGVSIIYIGFLVATRPTRADAERPTQEVAARPDQ